MTGGTDWLIKRKTKNVFVMRTAEEFVQQGRLVGSYTECNGVTAERLQNGFLRVHTSAEQKMTYDAIALHRVSTAMAQAV